MDPRFQSCPICRAAGRPVGVRSGYPMARCPRCAHLWIAGPIDPAALEAIYRRYSYDRNDLEHVPPFVLARLREVLEPLGRFRREGRLLDVGFGAGAVLAVARELGFEPHGIETSALAVEQAHAHGFQHARQGDFASAPYPPGHFDVIVMTELVEHLREPLPFLRRAFELLAPGGALYLTTPHGRGLSARLLGLSWSVVVPPEHVQLFSIPSLRGALSGVGFGAIEVRAEGVNPLEILHHLRGRPPGPGAALAPEGAADPGFNRVQSGYALNRRMMSSRLGRSAKALVNRALSESRLGDGLKGLAIKPG